MWKEHEKGDGERKEIERSGVGRAVARRLGEEMEINSWQSMGCEFLGGVRDLGWGRINGVYRVQLCPRILAVGHMDPAVATFSSQADPTVEGLGH